MTYHTTQPQRRSMVQLAAYIPQSTTHAAKQGIDRLPDAQTVADLLSHIGDGSDHRCNGIVQSAAHVT